MKSPLIQLTSAQARRIWLHAQRLDTAEPFGDRIVAALDLKTDRQRQKLLVQRWNWLGRGASRAHRQRVEAALHEFEKFQLGRS